MNAELEKKKEVRALYLKWLAEIDEQIAELEKPKQWEPKAGKWVISSNGRGMKTITMTKSQLFGTERQTEEQAERAAIAMRRFNRLLAYRDEFAPDYVFNRAFNNCYVYFDYDNTYRVSNTSCYCEPTTVYLPEEAAKELCKKLNSGKVVL